MLVASAYLGSDLVGESVIAGVIVVITCFRLSFESYNSLHPWGLCVLADNQVVFSRLNRSEVFILLVLLALGNRNPRYQRAGYLTGLLVLAQRLKGTTENFG